MSANSNAKARYRARHRAAINAKNREYKARKRAERRMPHQYALLLRVSVGKRKKFAVDQKERIRLWRENKLTCDPVFALRIAARRRIYMAFARCGYTKKSSVLMLLGASYEIVRAHLETTFQEGMTWANHGAWHIDHRIPLASATDEEALKKLLHYTNLQALWARDNIAKGARHG